MLRVFGISGLGSYRLACQDITCNFRAHSMHYRITYFHDSSHIWLYAELSYHICSYRTHRSSRSRVTEYVVLNREWG